MNRRVRLVTDRDRIIVVKSFKRELRNDESRFPACKSVASSYNMAKDRVK